jgi:hypothetical protein
VTGPSFTDTGLATGTWYYVVTAQDVAGNVGPASNGASAMVTGDVIAPAVSVTGPAAGATVSGAVSFIASASDDVGVTGVQFFLDGVARKVAPALPHRVVELRARTASLRRANVLGPFGSTLITPGVSEVSTNIARDETTRDHRGLLR